MLAALNREKAWDAGFVCCNGKCGRQMSVVTRSRLPGGICADCRQEKEEPDQREAFLAAIQRSRDAYYAAFPAQEQTLYQQITGEPVEVGVARAVAEMQAAKGVGGSG